MNKISWRRRLLASSFVASLLVGTAAVAAPAQAAGSTGTRSLAKVLAADGSGFDGSWRDFDIVDNAVGAVLANDPNSPVKVLANGRQRLTAFIPTDRAFKRLANDVLGHEQRSESEVFGDLAGALGVETIEQVLLYHVIPGATITYRQALQADGASLDTAAGAPLTVDVKRFLGWRYVSLVDADPNDANAAVIVRNINKGNKQIAHGITQVLRPADL